MNCTTSAIFGIGLIGASYFTMSVSSQQTDSLRKILSEELVVRYEAIIRERRCHYLQGLALGLVLSYLLLAKSKISNRFHKVSLFFAITLATSALVYMLLPKSDYMLKHLKTTEENRAWLSFYKTMRTRYTIGFVLGALAAVPLAYSFC